MARLVEPAAPMHLAAGSPVRAAPVAVALAFVAFALWRVGGGGRGGGWRDVAARCSTGGYS